MRRVLPILLLGALLAGAPSAPAMTADDVAAALTDSLLLAAADFAALQPVLLPLTTALVADTAWSLVPRLVGLDRPDLLVDFLLFWEDRCGATEPLERTRILAAIWDGAFDEGLYDEGIAAQLEAWEYRDPALLTEGRRAFDAFTLDLADQLLPHQAQGGLPEYFCLLYSDRLDEADALLYEDALADTWLRYYRDHAGDVTDDVSGAGESGGAAKESGGPSSLLLTVGYWWSGGGSGLMGDHVIVGGLFEQRLSAWFLRLPVEVRLGRTSRPYLVDQEFVTARSDRFDAVYVGVEAGRSVWTGHGFTVEAFGGVGYDGVKPFLEQDIVLATVNVNVGMGLRWQEPGRALVAGLDVRREWLGARHEGPDSLSGDAWSLRLGVGHRFGPDAPNGTPATGSP